MANKHQSDLHDNMDRFDPREQPLKQQQAEDIQRDFGFDVVGPQPGKNIGNRPGPCEPRES